MDYTRLCPHCRKPVVPSDLEGYSWQCLDCDEDFFDIECWKALPICVYCDSTDLYTEEEILLENLTDLFFPEHIVREWHSVIKSESPFEEWYNDICTAEDTDGLYDFARSRGFSATR